MKLVIKYQVSIKCIRAPFGYLSFQQDLLRQAIDDQFEATKSGLEYLQVGAKKTALENIVRVREEELARTLEAFRAGQLAITS